MSRPELSVVTFAWNGKTSTNQHAYRAKDVNTLARMVSRNLSVPHEFVCVTDQEDAEFDPSVRVLPLWEWGSDLPMQYRRLWMFRRDIGESFAPRILMLDLDCVILDDLRPVIDRTEPFVIKACQSKYMRRRRTKCRNQLYNASMILMDAGARPEVWERFDPDLHIPILNDLWSRKLRVGSDQAWIRHTLGPHEPKFTEEDGVYEARQTKKGTSLPPGARIVFFSGKKHPARWAERVPWVQEHYQ
jgi:hypothetical protein